MSTERDRVISITLSEAEWRLIRQAFQIAEQLTISVALPMQRLMAWDATSL